ncbi:hypothetical protein [Mycobacterium mantenii]|uniref:hypothetical protein n=1 Tax=Mycobacterium mantenii TaxID=560555 RepID=UPI0009EE3CB8|nr:hypothetical protein [Mycobacterium mantenii]
MSERIAGKTFSTPEEAGVARPTEEEIARAEQIFDEFEQKIDSVAPEDRVTNVSPKFWDDTSGTEYEQRSQNQD